MTWFKKLFQSKLAPIPLVPIPKIESYPIGITFQDRKTKTITLTRQRIEDVEYPIQGNMGMGAWTNFHTGVHKLIQYKYWCECGTKLSDGPTGGCAVCGICKKCKINFGADLPGFWGH